MQMVISSGVLLKMEVGIRKGAWQRVWRYPAYLWSLRWVYAVKKTRRLVYGVYLRIPPNTPLVISLKCTSVIESTSCTMASSHHWHHLGIGGLQRYSFIQLSLSFALSCKKLTHDVLSAALLDPVLILSNRFHHRCHISLHYNACASQQLYDKQTV